MNQILGHGDLKLELEAESVILSVIGDLKLEFEMVFKEYEQKVRVSGTQQGVIDDYFLGWRPWISCRAAYNNDGDREKIRTLRAFLNATMQVGTFSLPITVTPNFDEMVDVYQSYEMFWRVDKTTLFNLFKTPKGQALDIKFKGRVLLNSLPNFVPEPTGYGFNYGNNYGWPTA